MPSRTLNIIKALYGSEVGDPAVRRNGLVRANGGKGAAAIMRRNGVVDLFPEDQGWLSRRNAILLFTAAVVVFHVYLSVYYFNKLTSTEQDVAAQLAKIESLLERRRNMSVNLARTLLDYAAHEKHLFRHVSEMRASFSKAIARTQGTGATSAPPAAAAGIAADPAPGSGATSTGKPAAPKPGKSPALPGGLKQVVDYLSASVAGELTGGGGLSGLLAFAEQYPDLKLSGNFQRFMDALVEVEKDIAGERIKCADLINTYTTARMTFPGNLFAALYGFEEIPYFETDPDAKVFTPVEY